MHFIFQIGTMYVCKEQNNCIFITNTKNVTNDTKSTFQTV